MSDIEQILIFLLDGLNEAAQSFDPLMLMGIAAIIGLADSSRYLWQKAIAVSALTMVIAAILPFFQAQEVEWPNFTVLKDQILFGLNLIVSVLVIGLMGMIKDRLAHLTPTRV